MGSVAEEKENKDMVAGLDPNFGMVPAFGKAKECQEKEKVDREEEKKDGDLDQRLRSMSLGASSWKMKRKKKGKEATNRGGSKEDLRSERLLVWSDIDWARKVWN